MELALQGDEAPTGHLYPFPKPPVAGMAYKGRKAL